MVLKCLSTGALTRAREQEPKNRMSQEAEWPPEETPDKEADQDRPEGKAWWELPSGIKALVERDGIVDLVDGRPEVGRTGPVRQASRPDR